MSPATARPASAATTSPAVTTAARLMSTSAAGRSARFPHCARGGVLEQDAVRAEAVADRIRLAEVLAAAGRVPRVDGRGDLVLAEAGARAPAAPPRGEEVRGPLAEDAPYRGDAGELAPRRGHRRAVARVERAVQLAHAVEDVPERLRRIEVVVHRAGELGQERRERARQ